MYDPTTIGIIATALSIAGTAANYIQSEEAADRQEKAQRDAAQRESAILSQQAEDEMARGKEEAEKIKANARRIKSSQEAALGGSGVKLFEGTGADILSETDKLSELDALAALKDSTAKSNLLRSRSGNLLAADYSVPRTSTLLGTGLSLAGKGLQAYGSFKSIDNKNTELKSKSTLLTSGSYD